MVVLRMRKVRALAPWIRILVSREFHIHIDAESAINLLNEESS